MKQLSDTLGNKNYFSNSDQPDVVDLALWSSFMKLKKKDNLPQNLTKWLERSSSYFGMFHFYILNRFIIIFHLISI